MKKLAASILATGIVLGTFGQGTNAESGGKIENGSISINNHPIYDGVSYLPVRGNLDHYMYVSWGRDVEKKELGHYVLLERNGKEIKLYKKGNRAEVDGKEIATPYPLKFTEDDRVMIPLRYVGEFFGAEVVWNGERKEVEMIFK